MKALRSVKDAWWALRTALGIRIRHPQHFKTIAKLDDPDQQAVAELLASPNVKVRFTNGNHHP